MLSRVDLLSDSEEDWPAEAFWPWTSLRVVPDRYETNAGIIGSMHGEKNDPAPARADTRTLVSTKPVHARLGNFWINTLFQISSKSTYVTDKYESV